jgi:cholesterol oxidase
MVGCRVGAKNTLVKNYLWFAERNGAEVLPEREVTDIRPLGAADGTDGYVIETVRPGAWVRKQRQTFTARGVIVAAGALGTNALLARCKHGGSLPGISDQLGNLVRTNSESILAVKLPRNSGYEPSRDVAISSSIHPREDTHIEFVTYGRRGDLMSFLFTLIVGDGTRVTRPLKMLASIIRHPIRFVNTVMPWGWGRRAVVFLVMQSLDNAIRFRARRRWFGRGVSLTTEQDADKPNPTYIDVGNQAAEWLAKHTGGIAQSVVLEAAANIPTTAHILGGAVIGRDAKTGVVDRHNRVFGYRNLMVCDGAALPANPGVNPSLTITAIAEHAMAAIPEKKPVVAHAPALQEA